MNDELIKLLKDARSSRGLRQQDVADMVGVKNNTLSDWERGRTEPDIDTFVRLCGIYGISCVDTLNKAYKINETSDNTTVTDTNEQELLTTYRELNTDNQAYIRVRSKELLKEQMNTEISNELTLSKSVG